MMDELHGDESMPIPSHRRRTARGCVFGAILMTLVLFGLGYLVLEQAASFKESKHRMQTTSHLKQLAMALHTHDDHIGHLPGANAPFVDPKDSVQKHPVSWRVLILRYIEQEKLFNEYRFDEPWDGPNNMKLLQHTPKIYRHPKADEAHVPVGHTHYRVFASRVGAKPSALFTDGLPGSKLKEIPDGTSNTIMVIEADEAVPWTMPEILLYDRNQPVPKVGGLFKNLSLAIFADGSVRSIRSDLPEDKLRAWITKDGGERVDRE